MAYSNIPITIYGNDPSFFDIYNICDHMALWLASYDPEKINRNAQYTTFDLVDNLQLWYEAGDAFFAIDPIVMSHSFRAFHNYLTRLGYTGTVLKDDELKGIKLPDYGRFRNVNIFGYYLAGTNPKMFPIISEGTLIDRQKEQKEHINTLCRELIGIRE